MNGSRSGQLNRSLRRTAQYRIVVIVLQLLHDAWAETDADKRISRKSHEDSISDVLRWKMVSAKNRLKPAPQLRFEREPQSDNPSLDTPTGLIDIKVLYTWNDETYLTMECKRISSDENSLALEYVRKGINRFVTGKYSPGHAFGIMVGYSICGKPDDCAARVHKVLTKEPLTTTGFDPVFGWRVDSTSMPGVTHFRSCHHQFAMRNPIELIQRFLSLN